MDSAILDHKRDSAGNIIEYYSQHGFTQGNNGAYFMYLTLSDTLNRYVILTKHQPNGDTIFRMELHSNLDAIDSLWQGSFRDYLPWDAHATPDGGLIILGSTNGLYYGNFKVSKIDSVGVVEWEYKIQSDSSQGYPLFTGISLTVLPDTSYVIAYQSNEGWIDWHNHIYLKKLDKNGKVLKTKIIGNYMEYRAPYIRYNKHDGHLYLAYAREYYGDNSTYPSVNDHKPNLMKLDTGLNIYWKKVYGNSVFYNQGKAYHPHYGIHDMLIDNRGGITILGYVLDDISVSRHTGLNFLLKLNTNGDSLWFKAYDFIDITGNNLTSYPYGKMVENDDRGYTIITNIEVDTFQAALVYRVDSMGCPNIYCSVAKVVALDKPKEGLSISPNPVYDRVQFAFTNQNNRIEEIEIYDINGRVVFSIMNNSYSYTYDASQLAKGLYMVRIKQKGGEWMSSKFIKE